MGKHMTYVVGLGRWMVERSLGEMAETQNLLRAERTPQHIKTKKTIILKDNLTL